MLNIIDSVSISKRAKLLFAEKRANKRLDGWFLAKEIQCDLLEKYLNENEEIKKAKILREIVQVLPLSISKHSIFAGTQDDAFARSYALINPAFKVEEFSGYCDPTAVFNDIEPNDEFTEERIKKTRDIYSKSEYVTQLNQVYSKYENYTKEVIFFFEQVTGHLIPDFRFALKYGIKGLFEQLDGKQGKGFEAFKIALDTAILLAQRYSELAKDLANNSDGEEKEVYFQISKTLEKVPYNGADNLYEAIQSFIILWQVMCLEQTPNPFAFSVGNADRIFEPYRGDLSREEAGALLKHFLVFFNVADRSWAISQNLLISGRDLDGNDLTNETSYALLDAYFDMNLPQPILSVKLHKNTPQKLYEELGRFLFSPGVLTPSFFNDDSLFTILSENGIDKEDLQDISIAGCQEPLIMGKDNGNTTNTWLNLPKILEMTLTGGYSTITGEKLADIKKADLKNIREEFYKNVQFFVNEMANAGNGASCALSNERVPFLSCFMGGIENGIDLRDTKRQGTKYNGSGCLIHGLTIIADSFIAIDYLLENNPELAEDLVEALVNNFEGYNEIYKILSSAPKFGNNIDVVDSEAKKIAKKVSQMVANAKNYLGNPFRPDFSSPTTHLLYGYWVGATPDGRKSRDMLNYGVDPLYGCAENGLGFRILSNMKLDFCDFVGGYASHLGVDPKYFKGKTNEIKGIEFRDKIINPLFFNELKEGISPFYLYVNVTTPEILRKVLAEPKKYAPSGVYIMRIHGTFVNFLDLSPAIQQDIITRLDLQSATC